MTEANTQYKQLNESKKHHQGLDQGTTKIWYQTTFGRYLHPQTQTINPNALEDTHTFVGEIKERDIDTVFMLMQGETWSPNGEAKTLIKSLGLSHTSMSVGDIIEIDDTVYLVAPEGFTPYQKSNQESGDHEKVTDSQIQIALEKWGWKVSIDEGYQMLAKLLLKSASGFYLSHTENGFLDEFNFQSDSGLPNKAGCEFLYALLDNEDK